MSGLSRLRNMFRVPDLRNKIFFTIFIIFDLPDRVVHPGPVRRLPRDPGAEEAARATGAIGFLDLFSGGALTGAAVFALGIMPYITSSIIMQLLGVVIPKLEEWQNEGQTGQKKITQWTRYLTVALALMQSTALVFVLKSGKGGLLGQSFTQLPAGTVLIHNFTAFKAGLIILTWTAGTALVMWLGELITQRGIGNGMSILIFTSVVSRLPFQFGAVLDRGRAASVHRDHHHRPVHDPRDRRGRVGAAANTRAVRETRRRPAHVRRPEHLHPAEGQPVGCDPGDLRELVALVPRDPRDRAARGTASRPGSTTTSSGTNTLSWFYIGAYGDADPVLRVLLHGDRVQPRAAGRHHPQAGWVHPRHPSRTAHRALPREGAQPHHAAGRAVPDGHRAAPDVRAEVLEHHRSSRSAARRS